MVFSVPGALIPTCPVLSCSLCPVRSPAYRSLFPSSLFAFSGPFPLLGVGASLCHSSLTSSGERPSRPFSPRYPQPCSPVSHHPGPLGFLAGGVAEGLGLRSPSTSSFTNTRWAIFEADYRRLVSLSVLCDGKENTFPTVRVIVKNRGDGRWGGGLWKC